MGLEQRTDPGEPRPRESPRARAARPDRAWRIAFAVLLAGLVAAVLLTFRGYGLTWDEEAQRIYGDHVLAWWATLGADRSALGYENLNLYGGLFDALAQLAARVSPLGLYETRHLVNAAFGVAGVWATWRIGSLVGGGRAGFLSAAILALTPAYYGHSFNNPKDIPFAALAALTLLAALRAAGEAPRIRWRLVAATGVALGLALAVRVGGAILLPVIAFAWGAHAVDALRGAPRAAVRRAFGAVALRVAAAAAIGYAVMLPSWPWALEGPLTRPLEALRAAAHFGWNGTMLFDGAEIAARDAPWSYLPTWFAITLPEAYLVALGAGVALVARRLVRRERPGAVAAADAATLVVAVLLPVAAAIALRSVLYDAQRHFLFVLPPLAVLAGASISAFAGERAFPPPLRAAVAGLAAFGLGLTAIDMVQLHPYQTVYFNRLVAGGLAGAAPRFETDYWGATYAEGIREVVRSYRPADPWPIRVANCARPFQTGYWLERHPEAARFVQVDDPRTADLFLATTRWDCHHVAGRILHVVERQGVPLLYVIERRRRGTWVEAD